MVRSCKVAVIGAGMSGLVAARELLRECHDVTVFEKSNQVGGTWVYEPRIESDPVGLNPAREKVHGSLYASLRTNLPRPLMGFSDYPFTGQIFGDARQFPRHEEVLQFLESFASDYRLMDVVQLGSEVVNVRRCEEGRDRWMVTCRKGEDEDVEDFEAVVICNGHYSEPMVPEIPGADRWTGKQVHSHNYRTPESYENQVVVVIGMGPSGFDIAAEIANVAKEVYVELRNTMLKAGNIDGPGQQNIFEHQVVSHVESDGQVHFSDGFSVFADVILYCTGYKYNYPFLETNDVIVDDNRVGPLYKHVFPPKHGPWLSFVSIPFLTIIFLTAELQSKWIAQVLSGKCMLPSENKMLASVQEVYDEMKETGTLNRHTHRLYPKAREYLEWLAAETGSAQLERWWFEMHDAVFTNVRSSGRQRYRDLWTF